MVSSVFSIIIILFLSFIVIYKTYENNKLEYAIENKEFVIKKLKIDIEILKIDKDHLIKELNALIDSRKKANVKDEKIANIFRTNKGLLSYQKYIRE